MIKLYAVYHNINMFMPEHPLIFPTKVGNGDEITCSAIYQDCKGLNISNKNSSYCELTAQYWAWKNELADYYGFFHYRRYLSFNQKNKIDYLNAGKNGTVKLPYTIEYLPEKETLVRYGYRDVQYIKDFISQYDIVAPIAEEQHMNVYEQYRQAPEHNIEDLDYILEIIQKNYPDYLNAAVDYMKSTKIYFCNMFIMKKNIYHEYCNWLFDILSTFDAEKDCSAYQGKKRRVNGYLGERLFGIYYTWLKQNKEIKWAEVPRIHFEGFVGETDNFSKMKRINKLLPPGTLRRAMVKKLIRRI